MQLPLAHSGWLFKEEAAEEQEDAQPWLPKEDKTEPDPPVKGAWGTPRAHPGGPVGAAGPGRGRHPAPRAHPAPLTPAAVKEEPCDEDPPPATKPAQGPPGFPRDIPVAELLQRLSLAAEDELLFLQLPDTLPGQPPTQDTKPVKTELQTEEGQVVVVKQEKSQVIGVRGGVWGFLSFFFFFLGWFRGCGTRRQRGDGIPRRQEARQAENTCTLADLPEGQVGKLLVRKSGKVQLVLGKVTLDVTMGTPCSFLQVLLGGGHLFPPQS